MRYNIIALADANGKDRDDQAMAGWALCLCTNMSATNVNASLTCCAVLAKLTHRLCVPSARPQVGIVCCPGFLRLPREAMAQAASAGEVRVPLAALARALDASIEARQRA
jgi:hypothetical protein